MCDKKRKVSLIGIGTGGVKEMTERAKEEILASDCLIGASRMLESAACFLEQKKDIKRRDMLSEYRWDFIFSYVKEHESAAGLRFCFPVISGLSAEQKTGSGPFAFRDRLYG